MRKYVKLENNIIVSNIVIESNLVAAFPKFDSNNPELIGFKEVLDIPPEVTNMQIFEQQGYSLKEDGTVSWDYAITDVTQEDLFENLIRRRRSFELTACDWTQTADAPLTAEKKAEWATYRQALRDLPSQYPELTFDTEIIWPTKPTK
jgi:hypothetical protein